MSLSRRSN
uniref:Uncharacterized protein n=1 Tax=Arundo donax TaxID=35708 RepID=A0A0A9AYF2_ARUDO